MKTKFKFYKYICHIHTKKSLNEPETGALWRNYLFNNLLGNKEIISEILYDFENNEKLGFIFPETFYYFVGFAGYDGRSVMPILQQDLIKQATPATSIEIDTYMSAIGFTKSDNDGKYYNDSFIVWDVVPRNVLKDKDGDIYVIDAEISLYLDNYKSSN